jgi:hypothetical protein
LVKHNQKQFELKKLIKLDYQKPDPLLRAKYKFNSNSTFNGGAESTTGGKHTPYFRDSTFSASSSTRAQTVSMGLGKKGSKEEFSDTLANITEAPLPQQIPRKPGTQTRFF